jgi:hypothetical protein
MHYPNVFLEAAMDHERYPYYADAQVRHARAERAARLRKAAAHAIGEGWTAARRLVAALTPLALKR